MDKKQLSERDICTKFIAPAQQPVKWSRKKLPGRKISNGSGRTPRYYETLRKSSEGWHEGRHNP